MTDNKLGSREYGATYDFSYNIAENPVQVLDLQATILHLLALNHERFTYKFKGRDFRLTDLVGNVLHNSLA